MDKTFITGCDITSEWMLNWFLKNYRKHNKTPITFVDFGISEKTKKWVKVQFDNYIDIRDYKLNGWFKKPYAIEIVNADKKIWIDTDIEIVGNMEEIFDHLELGKLSMCRDEPWCKRRHEVWHNSGVVGCIGNPEILKQWRNQCEINPIQGDQEVLHFLTNDPLKKMIYIKDLDNKYNWLRIQFLDGQDHDDKRAIHWTGQQGKKEIRYKLKDV